MSACLSSIILRNEAFGGVYFNQRNGRLVMVDQEGFSVLLKHINREKLEKSEAQFSNFFFNNKVPKSIKLKINRSVLFKKNAPLITDSPVFIDLSLNNYCNTQCSYCYMDAKPTSEGNYLRMKDFELLLSQLKNNRVIQIALGGGEPTLHPDFITILKRLRLEGDIIPNYTTNGINVDKKVIEATKKYCGAVAISLSEEIVNQNLELAKIFVNNKINTNLHVVLLSSRINNLAELVEPFCKLGISNIVLLLFKPVGRGFNLRYEVLNHSNKSTLSREVCKLLSFRKKYGTRLSVDSCSSFIFKDFPFIPQSIEGCTASIYSGYIDWDLYMKPCSFMQKVRGVSLRENTIQDAWHSSFFMDFRRNLLNTEDLGCKACSFFSSCYGGCPIYPDLVFCKDKKRIIGDSI